MIERCSYCNKEHETQPDGDEIMFGGKPLKVCPDAPPDYIIAVPPPSGFSLAQCSTCGSRLCCCGLDVDGDWPEIIE